MSSALLTVLADQLDHNDNKLPWKRPKDTTVSVLNEAKGFIALVENSKRTPPQDIMRKWLKSLAPLIESKKSLEEVEVRIIAMASLLDYPGYCFTENTLKKYAKSHRFLPNFADLCEFFDGIVADVENKLYKCRKMTEEKEYFDTQYEKNDVDKDYAFKMFGECFKALKEAPDDNS